MSEVDRERCLEELRRHEVEITSLSLTLAELDRTPDPAARARDAAPMSLDRHIAYINAQVMRHRISMALIESRLGTPPRP